MQFKFDSFNRYEIPTLILAYPNMEQIAVLCKVKNLTASMRLNATSDMSFSINNTANTNHFYDYIVKNNLIHMDGFGWWIIDTVDEISAGGASTKEVNCFSYEHMLTRRPVNIDAGTYKFYDIVSVAGTLLGEINANLRSWSIGYVTTSLTNKYRTFEMPDTNTVDFLRTDASEAYECVFDFDTENHRINAYTHDEIIKDTDIVFTFDNLMKDVKISTTDDDIVTCLAVYGAGEFSINNVNPLGTPNIYNFNHYRNSMSEDLWDAVNAWQTEIDIQTIPYGNLLTILKNLNVTLLKIQSDQTKVGFIRDSGLQVQTAHETYTLQSYSNSALTSIKNWISAQPYEVLYPLITEAVAYPAINFDSPPPGIESYVSQISAVDRGIAQALANIHACDVLLVMMNAKADEINAEISDTKSQLIAINNALAFINWFTDEQLDELDRYIIAHTYSNEYFVTASYMTYAEVQDVAMELLELGKNVLKRLSQPTYTFELNSVAYPFLKKYKDFIEQTELACVVHAEIADGVWVQPLLLEINIDWDDPENFSMVFGNRFRLQKDEYIYDDLVNDLNKVSSSVSGSYSQLMEPVRNGTNDEVRELLHGVWDASKNAILAGNNQAIIIDEHGIIGRRSSLDEHGNLTGFYDDEQFRMISNLLVFTDDNWQNVKTALGKIDLGNGNYAYGIAAEVIIGELIAGRQMIFTNESGTFRFDGNGATLTNADFSIISTNGLSRIFMNATDGFKIQTRENTSANWTDTMYIDTAGNLIMNGKITATSGNIGGWLIVPGGLSYNSNQLYLGVSPITASITGHGNQNLVFRAGSNFGVDVNGKIYARDAAFSNGTFTSGNFNNIIANGGTFTNIIASGDITANNIKANSTISSPYISGGEINGTYIYGVYGSFVNLTGSGYIYLGNLQITPYQIKLGNITIDEQGMTLLGATNSIRLFMNPPTATGGAEARWVDRGSYYSLGIYSSREDVKKNLIPIGIESVQIIDNLEPYYFHFKEQKDDEVKSVGFMAGRTAKVCKEVVAFTDGGEPDSVQYSNITAILTADAQITHKRINTQNEEMTLLKDLIIEQQKTIEDQEQRIVRLEATLERLVMNIE